MRAASPRTCLFTQESKAEAVFAIESGEFKTFISSADGTEQITGFRTTGEILGLEALTSERYIGSAKAAGNAAIYRLPVAKIERLCDSKPAVWQQLLRSAICLEHD